MIWIRPNALKDSYLASSLEEDREIYEANIDDYYSMIRELANKKGIGISIDHNDQSFGGQSIYPGHVEYDVVTGEPVNGVALEDLEFFINYEIPDFWRWHERKSTKR